MAVTPYTRRDGSVVYQSRLYLDGRKRYLGTFPTKRAAFVAEEEATKRARKVVTRGVHMLFFRDKWMAGLHDLEDTTRLSYTMAVNRVYATMGDPLLPSITDDTMDSLVAALRGCYAPQTVKETVRIFRQMLKAAAARGLIAGVPRPSTPVKARTQPIVPPTASQVRSTLSALEGSTRIAVLLAATTGLRRGEVWGLRVRDVHGDKVTVRQQYRNHVIVPYGKTAASWRTVHMPPETAEAMAALCKGRAADELVFAEEGRKLPDVSALVAQVIVPAMRAAGITGSMHMFRHAYASALIAEGKSTKVVQVMLGHRSSRTTLDIYGHLFPNDGADAAAAVGHWLGTNSGNKESRPARKRQVKAPTK